MIKHWYDFANETIPLAKNSVQFKIFIEFLGAKYARLSQLIAASTSITYTMSITNEHQAQEVDQALYRANFQKPNFEIK